ncbi:WbqC family protein [Aestuariivivens sediminicola]|uniref:WbqC family protein n=1 Tax=Aestuariivivens sediminicola TaxID=2913560 RepID=UPI001F573AF7|nr:WbqC family protein [Aestuariivivens sediminicola]
MQPYFFPYIGYFQLINAVDVFVFYDDANFIKKGYINRNYILVDHKKHAITVPCKAISQNKRIMDIDVKLDKRSISKVLKTIFQAYSKAPFFPVVYPILENFFKQGDIDTISNLAIKSVKLVCGYLDIQKKWVLSSNVQSHSSLLKGDQRIIQIAKNEKASTYINPIGGKALYSKQKFKLEGLQLQFIKSHDIKYLQFNDDFVPWLSIIDVLMFNSVDDIKSFLEQYELL